MTPQHENILKDIVNKRKTVGNLSRVFISGYQFSENNSILQNLENIMSTVTPQYFIGKIIEFLPPENKCLEPPPALGIFPPDNISLKHYPLE